MVWKGHKRPKKVDTWLFLGPQYLKAQGHLTPSNMTLSSDDTDVLNPLLASNLYVAISVDLRPFISNTCKLVAETLKVGGAGNFGISISPIRTKGSRLCPPYYYCPPPQSFWTMRRLTVGPNGKNPPKIRLENSWNWRTILFSATVLQILNMWCTKCLNSTDINWICWKLLGKIREITSSQLI